MRGFLARAGLIVCASCLLGLGAARASKVTTSNHNDIQLPQVEADPTLYVPDVVPPAVAAQTQLHVKLVREYVEKNIRPWLSDPLVVDTIKAQNERHAHITIVEINRLDVGFIERTDKTLIESTTKNPLATFLLEKKAAAGGVIFEIFIFDNKGLNVAQTDPTLDYMQGDEAKFQKTFLVGPDAVFIDAAEPDDGVLVAQANMTIKDPKLNQAIGAVTIGIALDRLGH